MAFSPPGAATGRFRARSILPSIGALAIAAVVMSALIGVNQLMNLRSYGLPYTVDVRAPAFTHAYGALARIAHPWQRYVVFPKEARTLAYAVSPAANELKPSLDGENGALWRRVSCEQEPTSGCAEILSSWFQWALRDAVAQAGHYDTLADADSFYARLAAEIDAACDRHAMPCLPARDTLAPPFRWGYIGDALHSLRTLLPELLQLGGNVVSVGAEHRPG